ncbi:hypothetical protein WJX73_009788 [Symbiochloris irregularis]|uniref:Cyclic nucleotide-binding domain-containing protein n=1 Tax=Symbiochloris irregularis TaxID=706552 RepID=A0AAW1PMP8_9CHLO
MRQDAGSAPDQDRVGEESSNASSRSAPYDSDSSEEHEPLTSQQGLRHAHSYSKLPFSEVLRPWKPGASHLPGCLLHPEGDRYSYWWGLTIASAAFTGAFEPFAIGFVTDPGELPWKTASAIIDHVLQLIFLVDMVLSFFVAHREGDAVVTSHKLIAVRYLRGRFWVDLAAWLPLDIIVMMFVRSSCSQRTADYISLLRLAHMVRLYRLRWWFTHLEYTITVSLLLTTLLRNLLYVFYSVHVAACGFYFIALQYGLGDNTWIGRRFGDVSSISTPERYIFSLYWSITTLATVGYGDLSAANTGEAIWSTIFMFVNLALSAYILGTITLLVVRSDEQAGEFREQSNAMKQYNHLNNLPHTLRSSMQEHLRLHFASKAASDEAVLGILPTPLRRRVLRHLYQHVLHSCTLFKDARQRFLDALLGTARIELFMPQVEILSVGDFVNEMLLIVAGHACLVGPGKLDAGEDLLLVGDDNKSVHDGQKSRLGPGEMVGGVAFFTEVPQMESVHSLTTCKILVVPRHRYDQLVSSFPLSARAVLLNLQRQCEQAAAKEFRYSGGGQACEAAVESERPFLRYGWSSPELAEDEFQRRLPRPSQAGSSDRSRSPDPGFGSSALTRSASMALSPQQEQSVSQLIRVRDLVNQQIRKQDADRTNTFHYAASFGDVSTVRKMLQQGFDANATDYDSRTALMLACAKGHGEVVSTLLAAGADPSKRDHLGGHALLEACKQGHDELIDRLKDPEIWKNMDSTETASLLCEAVFNGDLAFLRRLLRAGAPPGAQDYDARTPLHIAACEGHAAAAGVLVEAGGPDLVTEKDRWGRTPLDEADRVGAQPVINLLKKALQGS